MPMNMKWKGLATLAMAVAMLIVTGTALAAEWCRPEQNLLPDPDMHDTGIWKVTPEMSFQENPDKPGAHVLKVERSDPKQYHHTNRPVSLKPGSYHLKA